MPVRRALERDGWTITNDPLRLRIGRRNVFIDLGAERLIAAERGTQRIAVEIKTFEGLSEVEELRDALGQFVLYRELLAEQEPDRLLYLAVPVAALEGIFAEEMGQLLLRRLSPRIIGYNPEEEVIERWIP
jgi:XisH protein